jgi:membrane-bound metal-dependent hydrolase YbcI (DUF457 family)
MDVGTQGLASLVIARAFLPRASWRAWAVIVVAGAIANVDFVSSMLSPNAYLEWHRTYAHSIVFSLAVSLVLAASYTFAAGDRVVSAADPLPSAKKIFSPLLFLTAVIFAGLLHLVLDAAQSAGAMIFWPLSHQRVALDWLPRIDPWVIAILSVALLLPELTRLVSDEIGAKSKGPRGRIGAIAGLVVLALYVGLRAELHSNAVSMLRNLSYDGERPHRIAAYPDAGSPFTWHGIVDTERALHEPVVAVLMNGRFDPDNGEELFKPEPSPVLDQAQHSDAARRFLAVAQFPKAAVETTSDGHNVEIRDLRYAAIGETKNEIRVRVEMDASGKILNNELVWARDASRR